MELKKISKEEQKKKVKELLEAVQLPGFEKRKIREMSGGQKQRVALARALAADPKILLLDEPFSSLDENLRYEMARLVKKLHMQMGLTAIMVTHDISEAISMADKILILSSRPAIIKKQFIINIDELTPLKKRQNPKFQELFEIIWEEINNE